MNRSHQKKSRLRAGSLPIGQLDAEQIIPRSPSASDLLPALTIEKDLGKIRVLCRFTLKKRSHFGHCAIATAERVNSLRAYCSRLFFIYGDNASPSAQALNLIESAEDEQVITITHLKQV